MHPESGSPSLEAPFELRFEYANENRQACVGLGGTGVAVLTFLLFFLYGRFDLNSFDGYLYRATLATVVLSIFFFGISGSFYYFLLEALERKRSDSARFLAQADMFFVIGLALLMLEPGLILVTVSIYDVGTLAFILWAAAMAVVVVGRRWSR